MSGRPATPREVRPLQILTGGNPRLLVMTAEFARHRSLRRLMSELVTLIDEHTEYFRGHLEVLAKTERRVYVAVIDLWQPSSASEIAARARVDIRVASTMLGRLVERGAVVRQGRGRKRLYAAAEPLYSMYYKLRRERDEAAVVENLIRFMVACYDIDGLLKFYAPLSTEAAESDALRRGIRRALAARPTLGDCAVDDENWSVIQQVSEAANARAETIATQRLRYEVEAALAEDQFDRVVSLVEDYVASGWLDIPESMADLRVAWATYLLAFAHAHLGNPHAVLSVSERVLPLADSDNATILAYIAPTLVARASAQMGLGEFRAAIATCDDLIRRFGSWQHPPFDAVIAETLATRGCSKAHLGDDPGAVCDFEEVVDRFDDNERLEVQASIVSALMSKGFACRRFGDLEGEIASYDAVIESFDSPDAPDFRSDVAVALGYRCMVQAEIGLTEEALAGCEHLERLIPSLLSGEPTEARWAPWLRWRGQGARALALAVQKDYQASLDSLQTAYNDFIADDEVTTQEAVRLVSGLVAAGSQPEDLVAVLTTDATKAASLRPLIVALHMCAGEPVRAPREIEEVAADIRERFRKAELRAAVRETLGQITLESDSVQVLSLSRDKRDFEFPFTMAPINFSVLRSDGSLSNRWGVQVNRKGDAYVYCRDTPNAEKVSLHASGRQHISMPVETAAQVGSGTRFGNIWKEPEFDAQAIPTFSLVFPPWGAGIPLDFRAVTKDELVIVGHKEMTVVVAFFVVDSSRRMRGHIPHFVLGRIPLRPGKTLHIIAWKEPENGLMDRVRSVFPQISQTVAQQQLDEGEFTLRLQGYRGPNSAYLVTVPVRYTPPSEEA